MFDRNAVGPLPGFLVVLWALWSGPAAGLLAQQIEVSPHSDFQIGEEVSVLAFSVDGDRVVLGGNGGMVALRDIEGEETLWETGGEGRSIHFISFLEGDSTLVAVDEAGGIVIHSARSGEAVHRLDSGSRPEQVALDDDRRMLAVAGRDAEIELFDLSARQRMGVIDTRGEVEDPLFLGFDRRGRQLLAVAGDGALTAWDPSTLEPLRRVTLQSDDIHGSRSVVHAVGQDRSANILVAALEEVALPRGGLRGPARPGDLVRQDQLLVFDWYSGAEIRRVAVTDGSADVVRVGPGNDHAVVSRGARVTVMDLRRGERGAAITAPADVRSLAIAPNQDRLAIGSDGGEVALWNMVYREPTMAEMLDAPEGGISGRIRVLGEDDPALRPEEPMVMAVLPFDDRDGDGRMSQTVAELLVTQLANLEHLTLVERMRIDDILAEQDLQREGITEPGGMELGQLLNADFVLLGSIGASGSSVTFSARVLEVASGEVVSGRQVLCEECRAQDLFDAIHMLGNVIAR